MKRSITLSALSVGFFLSCVQTQGADPIYRSDHFTINRDSVTWLDYSATISSPDEIRSDYPMDKGPVWRQGSDISGYPVFSSGIPLLNAMYALSLDDLERLKEPDGLFRTGASWSGVWTRDYSQSILLSLAFLTPDIAMEGLMKKTTHGVIVQDTGTGGSWPVSTDRMIWALAAWEIYKYTGDMDWLKTVYPIIKESARRDRLTAVSDLGLYYGETSTMDWRENSYPAWMQPVDIFQSMSLSLNAIQYEANRILADMAEILGEDPKEYRAEANAIKQAINDHLWMEDRGYYGVFLYGKNYPVLSKRSDAQGEAFCVLYDVADEDRQAGIIESTPVVEYGIPLFHPYKPDAYAYHNNAIWPYVQAHWNLAAAKVKNTAALEHGLASIYRAAALFLSNKENMVASSGNPDGTAVNSDRQLWSVAGNLAMVFRVFAGMNFEPTRLTFNPVIPEPYGDSLTISNFVYRNARLNITIEGHGATIKSFKIDGRESSEPFIDGQLEGTHAVHIQMASDPFPASKINQVENRFTPEEPSLKNCYTRIIWNRSQRDQEFRIYENGILRNTQTDAWLKIPTLKQYTEFQVQAVDHDGLASFLSKPFPVWPENSRIQIEIEAFAPREDLGLYGYTGEGYVETTVTRNPSIRVPIEIKEPGKYLVEVRYSNGNGRMCCTHNCGIRSLSVDNHFVGAFVFPVLADNNWSHWGWSNTLLVELDSGHHELAIEYQAQNENMNVDDNRAILDALQLTRLGGQ